jgi:hypothetical protein
MLSIKGVRWADAVGFESCGVRIGLRATRPDLLNKIAPFLPPHWKAIDRPPKLDGLYSWIVERQASHGRIVHTLYDGVQLIALTRTARELLETFERSARMKISLLSPRFVFIHAGVVGWRGRAIVIPGRSMSGKSTLVRELVAAGADYFSDEFALLDRHGWVHPFPLPISIREPETFVQRPLKVQEIGGRIATSPQTTGAIVVTGYKNGARSRFRRSTSGQGSLALMANAVAAREAPMRVLKSTCNASARALVLRGSRGEAREAVGRVMAALEERFTAGRESHPGG